MKGHLSSRALEGLATGAPVPSEWSSHARTCEACTASVQRIAELDARVRQQPAFERTFRRLELKRASRWDAWRSRGWLPSLVACATAATVLLVVRTPPSPTTREKGSAFVDVIRADGSAGTLKVGERVGLKVFPSGYPYAVIFGVDDTGQLSQLWPLGETHSGLLPTNGPGVLAPAFEVTQGSMRIIAVLSTTPLATAELLRQAREGTLRDDPGARVRVVERKVRVESAP